MVFTRDRANWLPSDDSEGSAFTWPATSSPLRPSGPREDKDEDQDEDEDSLPASSPTSSIAPYNSGQRIDSSDPGVNATSPIKGPKEERLASIRRKAQAKRSATIGANARAREETREREEREAAEKETRDALARHTAQQQTCSQFLQLMQSAGITLGTFLLFLFDPETKEEGLRNARWEELFSDRSVVDRILTSWTSGKQTPPKARETVSNWMVSYVGRLAALESMRVTRAGWMRSPADGFGKDDVLAFDLGALYPKIKASAPVTLAVVSSFATSRRQIISGSEQLLQRKQKVLTQVMTSLLREHSRRNDYVAVYNGLYLYATGAQRQTISVLSHSGWSCSYPRLIDRVRSTNRSNESEPLTYFQEQETTNAAPSENVQATPAAVRRKGIIPTLSASCMQDAQRLAATHKYKTAYDNINFTDPVAEQTLGHKDTQQNMTNATAVPLHANQDGFDLDAALDLAAAEAAFLAAPPLDITDIMFTNSESKLWEDLLIHSTAEIIVDYGPEGFERFRTHLDASQPPDDHQIRVHKTPIFPLQTMDIDEAPVTGNIDVVDDIHVQLGVDLSQPDSAGKVRLFFGDQLTIARLRSIVASRAGHEREAESWRWAKPVLALFHTDMAAVSCVFATHYGTSEGTGRDPGSLWSHNSVLDRKPIVLTSLPPYRVCRDLVYVSLYARVLHCLQLVSGQPNLSACVASIQTWSELLEHARSIYRAYASTSIISGVRRERTAGGGDIVFENAVLFLRDALGLRTFGRAVKSGRSGHIVLALKWLALMFKAGGHPKYAREMLFLLHHLTHVWPPKLRDLILSNWLVNPTGHKDGWVALDLMQEHLNFWIKKMYAAHGSNGSWEWLAMISPCIEVLRSVANQMHASLGSYQGRTHTTPDLTRDIQELMRDLEKHRVYTQMKAREDVGEAAPPVTDLLTEGFGQMVYGASTALSEHNEEFRTLQERCRVKPLQPYNPEVDSRVSTAAGVCTIVLIEAQEAAKSSAVTGNVGGNLPRTSAPDPTAEDGTMEEEADSGSESGSESSDTVKSDLDGFADYSEYDELYLKLVDEYDVDLDPDRVLQEADDSGDELDDAEMEEEDAPNDI
ncbi:hypothetical protein AURDEDRAFT_124563 [Auricularia subglabra TFB-10046 SS5]|nr:hypothetical protein AURDEDRAFT_124563 [Auricularia subglabra TFB-10046 SS5]